jgi:hypothetical protein
MLVIGNRINYSGAQFRTGPGFGAEKLSKPEVVGFKNKGNEYRSRSSAGNFLVRRSMHQRSLQVQPHFQASVGGMFPRRSVVLYAELPAPAPEPNTLEGDET